jgi:cold-inducible RNA-binding protein
LGFSFLHWDQPLLRFFAMSAEMLYPYRISTKEEYLMNKKLYVGNMPYDTTQDQIRTLFAEAGEVSEVTLITDRETGRAKGFGFVEMATEEGGREAIKRFNGHAMGERTLTVNEARPREERSGGSFGDNRRRF